MFFDSILCWFLGHIPDETVKGFVSIYEDIDLDVSVCARCDCTLVYDEQLLSWVKW